jgi:hypothetical protein
LWRVLSKTAIEAEAQLWADAAGGGPGAGAARDALRARRPTFVLSQAEVAAEWLRQWHPDTPRN